MRGEPSSRSTFCSSKQQPEESSAQRVSKLLIHCAFGSGSSPTIVPEAGLEPARAEAQRLLRTRSLPIPPLRHACTQFMGEEKRAKKRPGRRAGTSMPQGCHSFFSDNYGRGLRPFCTLICLMRGPPPEQRAADVFPLACVSAEVRTAISTQKPLERVVRKGGWELCPRSGPRGPITAPRQPTAGARVP
jgi:hypothetical protein